MKKSLFALFAFFAMNGFSSLSYATTSEFPENVGQGILLDFNCCIDKTKGHMGNPKTPVLLPCIYQEGHTLYLIRGCELTTITLKDASGSIVFSTVIPEGCYYVSIPDYLVGEYELHIRRGDQCFCAEIEL